MSSNEIAKTPIRSALESPPVLPGKSLPVNLTWVLVLALAILAVSLYLVPDGTALALAVAGLGLPCLWLVWRRPEIGLLGLVFLTSGFIPANTIDVRLPVGGLDARDLVFLAVGGLVLLRALLRHDLTVRWRWVGTALAVFWGLAGLSALYALFFRNVEPQWVFSELRPLAYYGTFFLVALAIRRRNQIMALLIGLFVLADLTAATLVIQELFGRDNPVLAAMTGGAWILFREDDPSIGFGGLRIIPPGHVLTYAVSIIAFCLLLSQDVRPLKRALLALQFIFLNAALVFTYSRAQWVASVIALALVALLLPSLSKVRLVRYGLAVTIALLIGYSLVGTEVQATVGDRPFVNAVAVRATSLLTPAETLESGSLQWRLFETDASMQSISQHPLLGVGLGGVYRDVTLLRGEAAAGYTGSLRFTRFVHNSYLYLAVKMGLLGLLAFGALALALLGSSWRRYAGEQDGQFKLATLGMLASLVGFLPWCVTQSHLLQTESTTVVGLLAGMMAGMSYLAALPSATQGLESAPAVGEQ